MNLQTKIEIPKSTWQISHTDRILLLGSCFADEIGEKFVQAGFDALVNPFGTLYNPASIAAQILRSISEKSLSPNSSLNERGAAAELTFKDNNGTWHSWLHHSRFSAPTLDELVAKADATTMQVSDYLRTADVLIITLGTAIIYRLKENGMLVANCHKQPDALFTRERLSSYDIVDQWQMLLQLLHSINPKLRIIFTVSPIRHKRDGYHINNISKGILLQAVDELCISTNGTQYMADDICNYFPSYEIVLDELRDYRFYADDMIHPSPLAVNYIWERFQDIYFSSQTRDAALKAKKELTQRQHRPIVK